MDTIDIFERYHACGKCNKKVAARSSSLIVKCENCYSIMKATKCKVNTVIKFTADTTLMKKLSLTVFGDVLCSVIPDISVSEDELCFQFLSLDNLRVKYDDRSIVREFSFMQKGTEPAVCDDDIESELLALATSEVESNNVGDEDIL